MLEDTARGVVYFPVSRFMLKEMTDRWSEPVQMKISSRHPGAEPELIFWRIGPNGERASEEESAP